jgi:hypothetical protein
MVDSSGAMGSKVPIADVVGFVVSGGFGHFQILAMQKSKK